MSAIVTPGIGPSSLDTIGTDPLVPE